MKLSPERLLDPGSIAGGEDRETCVFPSPPQEIIDFNVCITVVAICHGSTFAKKSIRFVEKHDDATILRRTENTAEILFCLANIFGDYSIQIE
jgi:hypothetical protein